MTLTPAASADAPSASPAAAIACSRPIAARSCAIFGANTAARANRVLRRTILLGVVGGLACTMACTRVPQLEDRLTDDLRSQPYPALVPLDAPVPTSKPPEKRPAKRPETAAADMSEALTARAAKLRRRAAALRAKDI